jgi:hypothetical protein
MSYLLHRGMIVVWKLFASCRWNYGLSKLLTITEMETLCRQLRTRLPKTFISTNLTIDSMHPLFYHLSSLWPSLHPRVGPTGSVCNTHPLTQDEELQDNLLETLIYDDADLHHLHILNAVYRRFSRQGMLTHHKKQ